MDFGAELELKTGYTLFLHKCIKLLLRVMPSLFWFLLIFAFDLPYIAVLTIISALIHESGHIAAATLLTKKYKLSAVTSGFRLKSEGHLSYRDEMLIALAGPLANVCVFFLITPFLLLGSAEYAAVFGIINIFTALSNLLPIEGYDGYRIAECILCRFSKEPISIRILQFISFTFAVIICFIALYLIRSFDGGYWIFFIFIAALIKSVTGDSAIFEKKRTSKKRYFYR